MNLLAVERIKLFSTRSPWWCTFLALALSVGFTSLIFGSAPEGLTFTVADTQIASNFGLAVVMVLAALSVTTEYRFSTIRTTFQAVPNRISALLAKATVVGLLALVIGEVVAFLSWWVAQLLSPESDLALISGSDWTIVAGVGVLYALAAVIAIAVGLLVRHSAGAISLLLIYMLALEDLVMLIPDIGVDIHEWMPFNVANNFIFGHGEQSEFGGMSTATLSPGWSLAYFTAFVLVLLGIAVTTTKKRDA